MAIAPIYGGDNNVVMSIEKLNVLWAQQFASEFSGQVIGMSSAQLFVLPADRKLQSRVLYLSLQLLYLASMQLGYPSLWANGCILCNASKSVEIAPQMRCTLHLVHRGQLQCS